MKVGDKVYCFRKFDQFGLFVNEGECTIVNFIDSSGDPRILVHSVFGEEMIASFTLESTDILPRFGDYFVPLKKLRKEKLLKLNEDN